MWVGVISERSAFRGGAREVVERELAGGELVSLNDLEALEALAPDAAPQLLVFDPPQAADAEAWLGRAGTLLRGAFGVVIVDRADSDLPKAAHSAGFHAVVSRTEKPEVIAAVLKLVLVGGRYFPCFAGAVPPPARLAPDVGNLSRRQSEVLDEMVAGRTNKEIAAALGISIATVKLHVKGVLTAIGARNRTEAVSRMMRLKA